MANIIDRRLNGRNKSSVNRRKFLKRVMEQVRRAVDDQVKKRRIKDADKAADVKVKRKTISEPHFRHGKTGKKRGVHPGNKEFHKGDKLQRPGSSEGYGDREGSNTGDAEDDFIFRISGKEFLEVLFEGLALPDLVKTSLLQVDEYVWRKAGYTKVGAPANLNAEKSIQAALMRKVAMAGPLRRRLAEVEEELEKNPSEELEKEKKELIERIKKVPFIDDVDIRYNLHVKEPDPATNAVMFCIMDVSSSMEEYEKEIAKKFFILLHLFLKREYKKVDIVFLRHHHEAKEVDEDEFFYARESGGTVVSRVFDLMDDIIQERYNTSDWNIYAAQASDGDNWPSDNEACRDILENRILPYLQYFAYIEIKHERRSFFYEEDLGRESSLWKTYRSIVENNPKMNIKVVADPTEIWPVFRSLFEKRDGND